MPSPAAALAHDPGARVMVFVDGQNLYYACRDHFGHPLCHPDRLARSLAGERRLAGVRFYTGRPSPDLPHEAPRVAELDRRLDAMRRAGVTVLTRKLDYHLTWRPTAPLPRPARMSPPVPVTVAPYLRPREKGIDMLIGLEVLEFALAGAFDVGVVVSRDRDLCEIPQAVQRLRHALPGPVRLEAAVVRPPASRRPITVARFDYTHQITQAMFEAARDDTDYAVKRVAGYAAPERSQGVGR